MQSWNCTEPLTLQCAHCIALASTVHYWTTYELRDNTTCARSATSVHIRYQATQDRNQVKSSPQDRTAKSSRIRTGCEHLPKHWRPPWAATRFLHAKSWSPAVMLNARPQQLRTLTETLEPSSSWRPPWAATRFLHAKSWTPVNMLGARTHHQLRSFPTRGCHALRLWVLAYLWGSGVTLISLRVLAIDVLRHTRLSHHWYGHYSIYLHLCVRLSPNGNCRHCGPLCMDT